MSALDRIAEALERIAFALESPQPRGIVIENPSDIGVQRSRY